MIIVLRKKQILAAVLVLALLLGAVLCTVPLLRALFPLRYEDYIDTYSASYELDPYLVMGVISAESRFEQDAVSHKNAHGLMQITEDTAKWCIDRFGIDADVGNLHVPEVNIQIGCAYLDYLTEAFGGEVKTALAAYNAGQGNVKKWLVDPAYSTDGKTLHTIPFEETRDYVEKVERRRKIYQKLYPKE